MHLKRWITGLAALPFLLLLIFKGSPFLFAIVVSIVCILALWEYFRIVFKGRSGAIQDPIPLLAFIMGPIIIWAAYKNSFDIIFVLITLNLIISGLVSLPQFKSDPFISGVVAKQVLGITYIPLFLSCLVLIRNGINGIFWIFFLLCIIFAGDTGAYYIGRYLGRHKLCPAVSPGKTIEGSIGGLVANLGAGTLINIFFPMLPWGTSILFFLSIGAAGQVGDLFESVFKRSADVKDSGGILPGHGGVLDRIDALLFAAPVAYLFIRNIGT